MRRCPKLNTLTLSEAKNELKKFIRSHSDRGFLPYGGCNRVCDFMIRMVEDCKRLDDRSATFDIHLLILVEVIKLVSHADTSSGAVSDVVDYCLEGIEELCKSASVEETKRMFDAIIKTAKNKVFQEWEEYGYRLLRNTVYVVQNHKQAQTVYCLFPLLGTMYGSEEYPDRYVIEHGIVERLDGALAAEQYRMEHIHVPEIRLMAVEHAMSSQEYAAAERLCLEALQKDKTYGKPAVWAYFLERIYAQLEQTEKQIEMVRLILKRGDRSYYARLGQLYQSQGIWEAQKELILQELSEAYMSHVYAALLAEEGEWTRLLAVVQANPMYIEYYGKGLAREFPKETSSIYEAYIVSEAGMATDRRKYKGICKLIKGYYDSGAKVEAKNMIRHLLEKYPRRAAMVDELEALDKKL